MSNQQRGVAMNPLAWENLTKAGKIFFTVSFFVACAGVEAGIAMMFYALVCGQKEGGAP
jgi:hypothetical protein